MRHVLTSLIGVVVLAIIAGFAYASAKIAIIFCGVLHLSHAAQLTVVWVTVGAELVVFGAIGLMVFLFWCAGRLDSGRD
ncbi:MAG: hypothetical protein WA087_02905 [Candidatus Saccharimonadales bacterium]